MANIFQAQEIIQNKKVSRLNRISTLIYGIIILNEGVLHYEELKSLLTDQDSIEAMLRARRLYRGYVKGSR